MPPRRITAEDFARLQAEGRATATPKAAPRRITADEFSRLQAAGRATSTRPAETPADLSAGENFRQDALRVGREFGEGMSRATDAPTFGEGLLQATGATAKALVGSLAAGGEAIGRAVLPKSGEKMVEAGAAKLGAAVAPVVAPIGEAYSEFASENPRLARNLEAVGNVASALPVGIAPRAARVGLEGAESLATAGRAAARSITTPSPLGVAEVATGRAVEQVASRLDDILNVEGVSSVRKASERAAGKGTNVSKILAENRAIPSVADGKFQTGDAIDTLASKASSLSETLETGIMGLGKKTSISDIKAAVREAAIKDPDLSSRGAAIEAARKAEAQVDDYARQVALRDRLGVEMSDALDVYDQQLFKKGQYKESRAFRNDQSKVDSAALLARVFRQNIEKAAGSDAVRLVNREIGRLEEAMNVLSALDGKAVKGGRLGGIASRAIGATLGVSGGGPLGGIVGAILGGGVSAALQQTAVAGPIRRVLLARSAKAPSAELAKALRYLEDLGPLADEGVARTVAEAAREAGVTNLLMLPARAGQSRNPLDVVSVTPGGKASRSAQEAADVAAVETGRAKLPRSKRGRPRRNPTMTGLEPYPETLPEIR